MEQLQKYGIQIGFLFSGLFGAILMATKAAADQLIIAWSRTYDLNYVIVRPPAIFPWVG